MYCDWYQLPYRQTYNIYQWFIAPQAPGFQSLLLGVFSPSDLLQKPEFHNALNRKVHNGLKIWGNSPAMTEGVTITGSLHCLMPNGPLRVRLSGQLPAETPWTLCQFTFSAAIVMWHGTNLLLFADLWIMQREQNALTHFWSKCHYQGKEAFFYDAPWRIKASLLKMISDWEPRIKSLNINPQMHTFELNRAGDAEHRISAI